MARHKVKSTTVKILNPLRGGRSYTSLKKARAMVADRLARFEGYDLWLTEKTWVRSDYLQQQADRAEAAEFCQNRGGILFWNGNRDPNAFHLPGMVRS